MLARLFVLAFTTILASVWPLDAQVGNMAGTGYEGWKPSDRVEPVVRPSATYDSSAGLWRYSYTVTNKAGAEQDILVFGVNFISTDQRTGITVKAPPQWWGLLRTTKTVHPASGVYFMAEVPEGAASPNGPTPGQIRPGHTLSGFELTSPYPPGLVRTFIRGFAPLPWLSESSFPDENAPSIKIPADTTDAQRGWTIGPVRYAAVTALGGGESGDVDRLAAFINLRNGLRHPAPVPVALSLNADTDLGSVRISLNGVDVSEQFGPGPEDGASLVALFNLGSDSSLRVGSNRLVVAATGTIGGAKKVDRDVLDFVVPPATAALLRNLPE